MKSILLFCIIYSISRHNYVFAMAAILALFVSLLPQILQRNFRISLPWEIDCLITFALVLHIFFGEVLNFYEKVYIFDKGMHFFGTAIVAILGFMFVYAIHYLTSINLTLPSMGFFIVVFSLAVGALWEIAEFTVDQVFGLTTQYGLYDTMLDLIYDFFGGVVVSILGIFYIKKLEPKSRIKFHRSIREAFHIRNGERQ
ncbi:MAG: hypothetical protein HYS98_05505 [Deltaproteobacteria bacterium]|nr:hypothetical protein [Deltaproteobacteria bacterium]